MSDFALGKSIFGTDALKISKLFAVDGWVAIGPLLLGVVQKTDAFPHTVSGAGTGIGLVTAAALAENGCKVYIAGRRLELLEAAARNAKPSSGRGEIIPIQADMSTKEGILSEAEDGAVELTRRAEE